LSTKKEAAKGLAFFRSRTLPMPVET